MIEAAVYIVLYNKIHKTSVNPWKAVRISLRLSLSRISDRY